MGACHGHQSIAQEGSADQAIIGIRIDADHQIKSLLDHVDGTIFRRDLKPHFRIFQGEPGGNLPHRGKITFFQATGPREGAIINELFEGADGTLQLRFYCYLGLRGKEPNGPEEQAEQAQFDSDKGYKAALLSTLRRTRELLAEGRL